MKRSLLVVALLVSVSVSAQVEFSVATGLSGLRNLSPQQKFWAVGQTVQTQFHFSPKQSAYAWLDYYTEGKYQNNFTAIAKLSSTLPEQIPFTAAGSLTYRQFSLGWKHYFHGSYNANAGFNIYGLAGFGFLFAKISNQFSQAIDTSLYDLELIEGENKLQKLTFDLGLGSEFPIGANFFIFGDARAWLPASSTTSPYLHNQKNVPLAVMITAGLRVLFGMN